MKRGREAGRDDERIRNKFERYEKFVELQKRFFAAFHAQFPEKVKFLDSVKVEATLKFITSTSPQKPVYQDIDIFDFLVCWLRENKA